MVRGGGGVLPICMVGGGGGLQTLVPSFYFAPRYRFLGHVSCPSCQIFLACFALANQLDS